MPERKDTDDTQKPQRPGEVEQEEREQSERSDKDGDEGDDDVTLRNPTIHDDDLEDQGKDESSDEVD